MKLEADKYTVEYTRKTRTITFKGVLRLQNKEEYRNISELLSQAASETTGLPLILDMHNLVFLNSSGISSLSMFILKMRKLGKEIHIQGNSSIPWQTKSLKNFQKLYSKVDITFLSDS